MKIPFSDFNLYDCWAPSHYLNQCWRNVKRTFGINVRAISICVKKIFSSKKLNLKISAWWRLMCLSFNVLPLLLSIVCRIVTEFLSLWHLQYIGRSRHTVFALLCFVVVIHWLIFPYPSGLLHWHCGNLTIAPVPAKQPWWIWINTSCEFIMNDI